MLYQFLLDFDYSAEMTDVFGDCWNCIDWFWIFDLFVYSQTELSHAISMVSYYASSSEPAQIRGKTVYIQYSNRHEIVHNKSPGDVPGNVLLVTMEGVEAGDVSIDVIHLVSF